MKTFKEKKKEFIIIFFNFVFFESLIVDSKTVLRIKNPSNTKTCKNFSN